jgi:hypothetical protein
VPGPNAPDWRVAPLRKVLTFGLRAAQNAPASFRAPGWLRDTPKGVPDGSIVDLCQYWDAAGRTGVNCYPTQVGIFSSEDEFAAIVRRVLPEFHYAKCASAKYLFCMQNADGTALEAFTYGANYALLLVAMNAPPFHTTR